MRGPLQLSDELLTPKLGATGDAQVQSLSQESPGGGGMATRSNAPAWRIHMHCASWTEGLVSYKSMRFTRLRHDTSNIAGRHTRTKSTRQLVGYSKLLSLDTHFKCHGVV